MLFLRNFILSIPIFLVILCLALETHYYLTLPAGSSFMGDSILSRLNFYYSYFTILSNIFVAIWMFILIRWRHSTSLLVRVIRLDALVCITITMIVYNVAIGPYHTPPNQLMAMVSNVFHIIVPLYALGVWLFIDRQRKISRQVLLYGLIFPIVYCIYIFIRGAITGYYPYDFINVSKIGGIRAAISSVIIFTFYFIIAYLLFLLEKCTRKNSHK